MRKIIFLLFTAISSAFENKCYTQNDVLNSDKLFSYKNNVYDITGYNHPSGKTDLLKTVSIDASVFFNQNKYKFHEGSSRVSKDLKKMLVGVLKDNCTELITTVSPTSQPSNNTELTTLPPTSQPCNTTQTTIKPDKKTTFPTTKTHKTSSTPTTANNTYIPTTTTFNITTFPVITNTTTQLVTTTVMTTQSPIINNGLSLYYCNSGILLINFVLLFLVF